MLEDADKAIHKNFKSKICNDSKKNASHICVIPQKD